MLRGIECSKCDRYLLTPWSDLVGFLVLTRTLGSQCVSGAAKYYLWDDYVFLVPWHETFEQRDLNAPWAGGLWGPA